MHTLPHITGIDSTHVENELFKVHKSAGSTTLLPEQKRRTIRLFSIPAVRLLLRANTIAEKRSWTASLIAFKHCSHLKRSSSACLNMETFLTHNSNVLHIRRRRAEKIMHENKRKQKAASVVYTVIKPWVTLAFTQSVTSIICRILFYKCFMYF